MGTLLLVTLAVTMGQAPWFTELGIHEGKIVSAAEGKLSIIDEDDGDNEEFVVTKDTKITLNGEAAELDDLAAGQFVKVTSKQRKGQTVAVVIEARAVE